MVKRSRSASPPRADLGQHGSWAGFRRVAGLHRRASARRSAAARSPPRAGSGLRHGSCARDLEPLPSAAKRHRGLEKTVTIRDRQAVTLADQAGEVDRGGIAPAPARHLAHQQVGQDGMAGRLAPLEVADLGEQAEEPDALPIIKGEGGGALGESRGDPFPQRRIGVEEEGELLDRLGVEPVARWMSWTRSGAPSRGGSSSV